MDLLIDWKKEVKVLVEDCSFEEERFCAQQGADFASNCAWQKLLKDYGEETLKKYHKWRSKDVVDELTKCTKDKTAVKHQSEFIYYSTRLSAHTLTEQVRVSDFLFSSDNKVKDLEALVKQCSLTEKLFGEIELKDTYQPA